MQDLLQKAKFRISEDKDNDRLKIYGECLVKLSKLQPDDVCKDALACIAEYIKGSKVIKPIFTIEASESKEESFAFIKDTN